MIFNVFIPKLTKNTAKNPKNPQNPTSNLELEALLKICVTTNLLLITNYDDFAPP